MKNTFIYAAGIALMCVFGCKKAGIENSQTLNEKMAVNQPAASQALAAYPADYWKYCGVNVTLQDIKYTNTAGSDVRTANLYG